MTAVDHEGVVAFLMRPTVRIVRREVAVLMLDNVGIVRRPTTGAPDTTLNKARGGARSFLAGRPR